MKALLETMLQLYQFLSNSAFRWENAKMSTLSTNTKHLKCRRFFSKKITNFYNEASSLHQISRAVKIAKTAFASKKIRPSKDT